ncbi:MAG: response regulator transcription factor [bacterium]
MKRGTLLVWEDSQSTEGFFAQAVHSLSLRLLPASSLETCLKWLEGPVPVDALILNLESGGKNRLEEFLKLKKRPEMLGVPTLAILPESDLEADLELLKSIEDFVTTRASHQEIRLRTGSLLRRTGNDSALPPAKLHLGKVEMFPKDLRAEKDGKELKLTSLEFKLLLYFFKYQGRVLSREELLRQVWGYTDVSYTRTVDTFIKRLRSKLGKEGRQIETLRAVGYRMRDNGLRERA